MCQLVSQFSLLRGQQHWFPIGQGTSTHTGLNPPEPGAQWLGKVLFVDLITLSLVNSVSWGALALLWGPAKAPVLCVLWVLCVVVLFSIVEGPCKRYAMALHVCQATTASWGSRQSVWLGVWSRKEEALKTQ
jgi:hypothetical protein